MPLPISRSKLDQLGKRLAGSQISDADYSLLERVMGSYDEALTAAVGIVANAIDEPVTSRLKNTQTIVEKLQRQKTMGLKGMQDVAGIRVVIEGNLRSQDERGRRLGETFQPHGSVKQTDRRVIPSHGYRALHVVVTVLDLPVEIQLRTELQDVWAQIFERLGDAWGRQIRYGGQPENPEKLLTGDIDRRRVLNLMMSLSQSIATVEEAQVRTDDMLLAAVDTDGASAVAEAEGLKRDLIDSEGVVRTSLEQLSSIDWW